MRLGDAGFGPFEAVDPSMVYSTGDVTTLTGVSRRQLQWWDESQVVSPVQYMRRRLYSQSQVIEVSLIANLRRKGLSLQKARGILNAYREFLNASRTRGLSARGPDLYLITDGRKAVFEQSQQEIARIILDSKKPVIGLCISDLTREIDWLSVDEPA